MNIEKPEALLTDELVKRGIKATYEYPGFVMITVGEVVTCIGATGGKGEEWSGDRHRVTGYLLNGFDTSLPLETPIEKVADWVVEEISRQK